MLDKQGYTQAYACTPTHARALTHADKYATFIALSRQKLLGESARVLRYTHIICLI
jgi:hypothetical protein